MREGQDAGAAQEIGRAQAAGEPGGAAGRQDVRRAGGVIAQGDRGVMAQEDGAGVVDALGQGLGVARGDVQMFGADAVGPVDGLLGVLGQDQGAELLQAAAGQVAARQGAAAAAPGPARPRRAAARAR